MTQAGDPSGELPASPPSTADPATPANLATAANLATTPDIATPAEASEAQFGPHRFYAGELAVVMDEEIEHYRFAARDLAVLEAR